MAENKIPITINNALIPVYYKQFYCLTDKCQDNCCQDPWKIEFDKKDYLRLRRLDVPADFKPLLDQTVRRLRGDAIHDQFYAKFQQENGQCPLLTDGKLCSLQLHCGEDALPLVCRVFPRKVIYTPAAKEYSLSLGCEGVLKQLFDLREGVDFIEEPLPPEETRNILIDRERAGLYPFFAPVRSLCIDFLQKRSIPFAQRMLLLGLAIDRLRNLDWDRPDLEQWVRWSSGLLENEQAIGELSAFRGNQQMFFTQNVKVMLMIHSERPNLAKELSGKLGDNLNFSTQGNLMTLKLDRYQQGERAFEEAFGDMEYFFENVMVAVALYFQFPQLVSKEELWKGYVNLCSTYSFFRFAAIVGCLENETEEQLFHILEQTSRVLLHNAQCQSTIRDEFFEHNSSSLAHMAILVHG